MGDAQPCVLSYLGGGLGSSVLKGRAWEPLGFQNNYQEQQGDRSALDLKEGLGSAKAAQQLEAGLPLGST